MIYVNTFKTFIFVLFLAYVYAKNIMLNPNEFISIRDEITKESIDKNLKEFTNTLTYTKNPIIYLDSGGGSVMDGERLIHQMKYLQNEGIKVTCIANKAYSMAFHIFEMCDNRYIMEYSTLMSHQMSLGLRRMEFKNMKNYLHMIDMMDIKLNKQVANRIEMDYDSYFQKIRNDWWIYGDEAIELKLADEVVYVSCNPALFQMDMSTKQVQDIQMGESGIVIVSQNVTTHACPL
jgi:ATP-dependent protease ClpP protease subunit